VNGADAAPSGAPYANSARLRVAAGPLAGPTICRLVSILAGRARCPLDRLDDALLVCDAIIDHAPAHCADGRIGLDVTVDDTSLELRLGPLASSVGEAILADAEIPGIGNVLTQVSDRVAVQPVGEGEQLVLALDFDPARPSSGALGAAR
jgi:serine/threonine-protein kinase RsbW